MWDRGLTIELPPLTYGHQGSWAWAVNDLGEVVGFSGIGGIACSGTCKRAVIWRPESAAAAAGRRSGVAILNSSQNVVGGNSVADRNFIYGSGNGVLIDGAASVANTIRGNFVGLAANGTITNNNKGFGIAILDAPGNEIGANVVSGNEMHGIYVVGMQSISNRLVGNFVGTDPTGTEKIPNGGDGIHMNAALETVVGGAGLAERNVVSGNDGNGLVVTGDAADSNRIEGNFVGLSVDGLTPLGNSGTGILLVDGTNTSVGSGLPGAGNIISANGADGIQVGPEGTAVSILGNLIGTSASGNEPLGNRAQGIAIYGAGMLSAGTASRNATLFPPTEKMASTSFRGPPPS